MQTIICVLNLCVLTTQTERCPTVVIKGERHSGTRWARAMITAGCPCSRFEFGSFDADGMYGWKHGAFPFKAPPPNVLPLIIYRKADTWVHHMTKNAYENNMPATNTIETLIKRPFQCNKSRDPQCPDGFAYKNALTMRTTKYAQWYGMKGALHMCYEMLSPTRLAAALNTHGVSCNVTKMTRVGYISHSNRGGDNASPFIDAYSSDILEANIQALCV